MITAETSSNLIMNVQQVAFLGLGIMGAPMATNLAKKKYKVLGWNRTPDKPTVDFAKQNGVIVVDTIGEATRQADVIISCVTDVPDLEEIYFSSQGAVSSVDSTNKLFIDMSTIGTNAALSVNQRLVQAGYRFIDAPVSGGDVGAHKATLTIMVGGASTDFEQAQPLLACLGTKITHCGDVGSGQAVKLCNQVLCGVHMMGLCEAIVLAEKQGIDSKVMIDVCSSGAAGSWALSNLGPKICDRDFAPGFEIKNILKDLKYCEEAATTAGVNLPATSLSKECFLKTDQTLGTQGLFTYYQQYQNQNNNSTAD